MAWCDFTLRFLTPAFIDDPASRFSPVGVRDSDLVPFPVSSLRGALRYWLRALVGAHVGNNLDHLIDVESAVFGTASGQTGTPSTVHLRARNLVALTDETPTWLGANSSFRSDDNQTDSVVYLLGQGLWRGHALTRRYVPPGSTVTLTVANRGQHECGTLLLAALWCLQAFGGLGARTRRGFGTVRIEPPAGLGDDLLAELLEANRINDLPTVIDAAGQAARVLAPSLTRATTQECPKYPAFVESRFQIKDEPLDEATSLADALDITGGWLRDYRCEDGNATREYTEIIRPYLDDGNAGAQPFKIGAFGLPVNYSDPLGPIDHGHQQRRGAVVEPTVARKPARRASPLWLRVYRDSDAWRLRSLALLAEWLPGETQLKVKETTKRIPGYTNQPLCNVTRPSQDEVDAELRGWFAGSRPTQNKA